jgi:membrane-bound ClpP family serine protease
MELLPVLLIAIGIGLLVAEIFIPSFGFTGIAGTISILAGVIITAETLTQGIIMFLVVLVIDIVLMYIAYKFAASKKSPLILKESVHEEQMKSDLTFFINKEGVAVTALRPSGKGDFDGVSLDILTMGNFIQKGSKIIITEIAGKKIFVKEIQ